MSVSIFFHLHLSLSLLSSPLFFHLRSYTSYLILFSSLLSSHSLSSLLFFIFFAFSLCIDLFPFSYLFLLLSCLLSCSPLLFLVISSLLLFLLTPSLLSSPHLTPHPFSSHHSCLHPFLTHSSLALSSPLSSHYLPSHSSPHLTSLLFYLSPLLFSPYPSPLLYIAHTSTLPSPSRARRPVLCRPSPPRL